MTCASPAEKEDIGKDPAQPKTQKPIEKDKLIYFNDKVVVLREANDSFHNSEFDSGDNMKERLKKNIM